MLRKSISKLLPNSIFSIDKKGYISKPFITEFIHSLILILKWTFSAFKILFISLKNNIRLVYIFLFLFLLTRFQVMTNLFLRVDRILSSVDHTTIFVFFVIWLHVWWIIWNILSLLTFILIILLLFWFVV